MPTSHSYQKGVSEAAYPRWASRIYDVNRMMLTLPTFVVILSKVLGSSANSAELRAAIPCQEQDSSKMRGARSGKSEAVVKYARSRG